MTFDQRAGILICSPSSLFFDCKTPISGRLMAVWLLIDFKFASDRSTRLLSLMPLTGEV